MRSTEFRTNVKTFLNAGFSLASRIHAHPFCIYGVQVFQRSHFILQVGCIFMCISICFLVSVSHLPWQISIGFASHLQIFFLY